MAAIQAEESAGVQVEPRSIDELCVIKSLRPFWNFTNYSGALVDWCHAEYFTRCGYVLRYTAFFSVFLLLAAVSVFEFYQIFLRLIDPDISVKEIIPNFLWFFPFALTAAVQMIYVTKRDKIRNLMEKWLQVESQAKPSKTQKVSGMFRCASVSYFIMGTCSICGLMYIIDTQRNASYFVTSYEYFQGPVSFYIGAGIHILSITYSWILIPTADIIPPIVFFHLSKCFEKLRQEIDLIHYGVTIQQCEDNPSPTAGVPWASKRKLVGRSPSTAIIFNAVWNRYELLRELGREANDLFGWVILLNHGNLFIMLCSLYYYILTATSVADILNLIIFTSNAAIITVRALVSILLCCYLYHSTMKLRDYVANTISHNWFRFSEEERSVSMGFLSRLQEGPLTVCPLHLYSITPSTVLSLASIVVTYCIVLFQSNSNSKPA